MFVQKPGETERTFAMNAESDALLISYYTHVILRNCTFPAKTFLITQKSLRGHDKTSATSPLLKIINFHATGKI